MIPTRNYDPTVLRQVKTITGETINVEEFDAKVNQAIRDGWKLSKRYALPGIALGKGHTLIAEMSSYISRDEVDA